LPAGTNAGYHIFMNAWSEADRYLLDRVRQHDGDAWSQLVSKYQGRLLAFARARAARGADPEDLVQDTFLNFLKGLPAYRGDASLETYLFLLLRRRVIETLRGKKLPACSVGDAESPTSADPPAYAEPSASWYVRQDERLAHDRAALAAAIVDLVEDLRGKSDFRDLQLAEMLFYAQIRNNAIAAKLNLDEKYIALVKHRWLKRLRAHVEGATPTPDDDAASPDPAHESLLSDVWEEYRPSCPKRSTLGSHLLGTLDDPWRSYVTFHVTELGCRFCTANLDDLRKETTREPDTLRDRVMQSSVGFFRRPSV
jgi:RNA polymerase sigma factor (sigma-70 family)